MRDVIVVGGGPVGLATAIYVRQHGLSVTVVEPRTFPIDKACGEGLMPSAVGRLHELGITVGGRPFRGVAYIDPSHRAEAVFDGSPGHGVRRTWLSRALHERAEQAGVDFAAARINRIGYNADTLHAAGLDARYLIGADGLHSTVRQLIGIPVTTPGPRRFGQRRHFAVAPWTDLVEVYWARGCEAYVTPVDDGCVGIAVLGGTGSGFDERLENFPELRARVDGATHGSTLGAGPLRQIVSGRSRGRVALVGDAAGYVDALTGEGINVGLAQAEVLARCVAHDRLGDYDELWAASTRRYRRITESLLWARRNPVVGQRIVPAAARFPRLFARAVQQLA